MVMDDVNRGGRAEFSGWAFERFVSEVLAGQPGVTGTDLGREAADDLGVDLATRQAGRPVLVQAKTRTPQTEARLRETQAQLKEAAERYSASHPGTTWPRLIAAFPGVLSPRKQTPAATSGIEIWDGRHLRREARRLGIPAPEILATEEGDEPSSQRDQSDDLLRRLARITPGRDTAIPFEKYCEDMLNYLFHPPLERAIYQSSTESRVTRRDFILPNYAQDGFWNFMRVRYHADFVVADAKNYTEPIDKYEALKVTNYLTSHGTGLVALLLTRRGLRRSAKWTCREQWLLHDKLVLGLDDEDYRQMLLSKLTGDDPSDLIRQRIEDFRLAI
jgi:hypothetical protein